MLIFRRVRIGIPTSPSGCNPRVLCLPTLRALVAIASTSSCAHPASDVVLLLILFFWPACPPGPGSRRFFFPRNGRLCRLPGWPYSFSICSPGASVVLSDRSISAIIFLVPVQGGPDGAFLPCAFLSVLGLAFFVLVKAYVHFASSCCFWNRRCLYPLIYEGSKLFPERVWRMF